MSDSSPSILTLRSCGLGSNPPCPPMDPNWPCGHATCEVREDNGVFNLICIDSTDCAENCECREREVSEAEMKIWNITVNQRFMLECDEVSKERRTT